MRRTLVLMVALATFMAFGGGAALAGEVTGNGKNLWTTTVVVDGEVHHTLNGKSLCAFSGQEDAQFYTEPGGEPLPEGDVVKGEPGHAQSWGQIPKTVRDFLTTVGAHPGDACNPTKGFQE